MTTHMHGETTVRDLRPNHQSQQPLIVPHVHGHPGYLRGPQALHVPSFPRACVLSQTTPGTKLANNTSEVLALGLSLAEACAILCP